jgi:hypothetical protein
MKVKIKSNLKNIKSHNAIKLANFKAAHHKTIRYEGNTYFIRVVKIGSLLLADAENMQGTGPLINLLGKSKISQDLKKLCENNLVS